MSFSSLGSTLLKLGPQTSNVFNPANLLRANQVSVLFVQCATIKSKAFRPDHVKPAPFPYREKNYTLWHRIFDKTSSRLDENSKIIVVDGPVAIGKTKFAKQLAADLDMFHIEDANMDMRYINSYGFDMRSLDDQVPVSMQTYDEKKFCKDPRHLNSAAFQVWMYRLRFALYIDALAHVLSTGQGVVIERSPWSDKVFVEAMFKSGFITKEARRGYYEVKRHTILQLLRPHLIIYLDAPVSQVKENIKKRGLPHEQNSPALTDKFLQDMEDVYKTDVLAKLSTHAELLMYDWSEEGDVEAIVEDIERIDFSSFGKYDEKSKDWFINNEEVWGDRRAKYADQKKDLMMLFNVPYFDAPELASPGEDVEAYNKVLEKTPGFEYDEGFNPNAGDTNLLFKIDRPKYVRY